MTTSNDVKQIFPALIEAIAELENVSPNRENPYFKSDYADLASIIDAVKPILNKHGIAVVQGFGGNENVLECHTRIIHTSGEWIESSVPVKVTDNKAPTYGIYITYMRRYALSAMLNIATEPDKDGAGTEPQKEVNKASEPCSMLATELGEKMRKTGLFSEGEIATRLKEFAQKGEPYIAEVDKIIKLRQDKKATKTETKQEGIF